MVFEEDTPQRCFGIFTGPPAEGDDTNKEIAGIKKSGQRRQLLVLNFVSSAIMENQQDKS